jgi:hypothetical protein
MSVTHEELAELYIEMETLFEGFRKERAKEEPTHVDSYWQGKKDGIRIAMNLLHPYTQGEE